MLYLSAILFFIINTLKAVGGGGRKSMTSKKWPSPLFHTWSVYFSKRRNFWGQLSKNIYLEARDCPAQGPDFPSAGLPKEIWIANRWYLGLIDVLSNLSNLKNLPIIRILLKNVLQNSYKRRRFQSLLERFCIKYKTCTDYDWNSRPSWSKIYIKSRIFNKWNNKTLPTIRKLPNSFLVSNKNIS